MKHSLKILSILFVSFMITFIVNLNNVEAASNPYDVPNSVKNGWNDIRGGKHFDYKTGKKLIYDVYSKKGISGGYQIVNRNFGNGNKDYLNFEGWSALFGHAKHVYANNETYIVAEEVGTSNVKIYSTQKKNSLSATKDLEYNKQGPTGLYNECPENARNMMTTECNMRYNNVDFQAYIPMEDLFPNPSKPSRWRFYIVKKVNNHIVYDQLRLPFNFDKLTYKGGEISLSSGVNANKLTMNNNIVLRRSHVSQTTSSVVNELGEDRYFTAGNIYTMVTSNESSTVVFYGVNSTHSNDRGKTKYASSSYWLFGGNQAILEFTPDSTKPEHRSHGITNHRYKNGNDYWVQPNDKVDIRLRGYDRDAFLERTVIRMDDNNENVDVRTRYYYANNKLDNYYTSNHLDVISASRTYQSSTNRTREATFNVEPKTHGHNYNVRAWHTDNAGNSVGWVDTGMNLRIDGKSPNNVSQNITNHRYKSDNIYWIRPNDKINISLRGNDEDSGLNNTRLSIGADTKRTVIIHDWNGSSSNYSLFTDTQSAFEFNSLSRKHNSGSEKEVDYTLTGKESGAVMLIRHRYEDNVSNVTSGSGYDSYGWSPYKDYIGVDGDAPSVQFRNKADTANFSSRDWSNETIEVRLKLTDADSGVKRSRYAWTKSPSAPTESQWSSWKTGVSYVVSKDTAGEWYLHVQSEDNVGNKKIAKGGLYKLNNPPNANFSYPEPLYEGDTLELVNTSTDPDGHEMTARWKVTDPDGIVETFTSWDVKIHDMTDPYNPKAKPGTYTVSLEVTDEFDGKDTVTKNIQVIPLIIEGTVNHTERWKELHELLNNPEDVFFSGERFMLSSIATNYPISKVEVKFTGTDVNSEVVELTEILTEDAITNGMITHKGEIFESFMADPDAKLKSDTEVHFIFKATWSNGVIKEDVVTLRILDDVYDFYKLHKSN